MKMKLGVICAVMALLSGCGLLPPPEDTISPPKPDINISAENNDADSIVAGFLPVGASILPVKYGNEKRTAAAKDIDGDSTDEIMTIYKYNSMADDNSAMIMILKKGNKVWQKLYDGGGFTSIGTSGSIKYVDFMDITGDGFPEIFVSREQSLEVYISINDANGQPVVGAFPFNNINTYELGDIPDEDGTDGITELLVKGDLSKSPQGTAVMRWTRFTLADVTKEYPWYIKENADYFYSQVDMNPEPSELSSLEFAQERAGMYEEALESCNRMIELNKEQQKAYYMEEKRAYLLMKLGRYDEAIKAYQAVSRSDASCQSGIALVYEAIGDYDRARAIYKSISLFPYDENIQRIDAIEGEKKIYSFLRGAGTDGMEKAVRDIKSWGKDNNMVVNCAAAKNNVDTVNGLLVVDYHIDPSIAYGKENVGGHIIYWWEEGKLLHQGYLTVAYNPEPLNSGFSETVNEGMDAGFTAVEASLYEEGNDTVLKAVYKDEARDSTVNRMYRLKNEQWKLFLK